MSTTTSSPAPVGVYTEGAGGRPLAADAAREIENGKLKIEKSGGPSTRTARDMGIGKLKAEPPQTPFFNFQFSIFNSAERPEAAKA